MRRRRARGFTLIELLISMALASVGLMGLLALQVTAIRTNAVSRNFIEAVGVAQERIETVELAQYANISTLVEGSCAIPTAGAITSTITGTSPITVAGGSTTQYTRCTAVTVGASATNVHVAVQWTETTNGAAALHTVLLSTTRSP